MNEKKFFLKKSLAGNFSGHPRTVSVSVYFPVKLYPMKLRTTDVGSESGNEFQPSCNPRGSTKQKVKNYLEKV